MLFLKKIKIFITFYRRYFNCIIPIIYYVDASYNVAWFVFISLAGNQVPKLYFIPVLWQYFLTESGTREEDLDTIFSWQCEQVDIRSYHSKFFKICQRFNVYKAGSAICDLYFPTTHLHGDHMITLEKVGERRSVV